MSDKNLKIEQRVVQIVHSAKQGPPGPTPADTALWPASNTGTLGNLRGVILSATLYGADPAARYGVEQLRFSNYVGLSFLGVCLYDSAGNKGARVALWTDSAYTPPALVDGKQLASITLSEVGGSGLTIDLDVDWAQVPTSGPGWTGVHWYSTLFNVTDGEFSPPTFSSAVAGSHTIDFDLNGFACRLRTSSAYRPSGPPDTLLLLLHGNGGSKIYAPSAGVIAWAKDNKVSYACFDAQDETAPPFTSRASGHGGPDHISRAIALYDHLQSAYNFKKEILLAGSSMGGLALGHLAYYRPFPIAAAIGIGAAPSVALMFTTTENEDIKSAMRNAYGMPSDGSADANLDLYTRGYDWARMGTISRGGTVYRSFPTRLYLYLGTGDSTATVNFGGIANMEAISASIAALGGTCITKDCGAISHANLTIWDEYLADGILDAELTALGTAPDPAWLGAGLGAANEDFATVEALAAVAAELESVGDEATHANRAALDLVSGTNSGDQDLSALGPETLTSLGALVESSGAITTPADVDKFTFRDSVSGLFAHISWDNIKTRIKAALVKADVGLGNVDNTSDLAKPASTLTKSYIQSRGQNLISNGSGLLGNNSNFSGFTFDAVETHGGGGSFLVNANQLAKNTDEYIPIDTARRFLLTAWGKAGDTGGANFNAANRQYLGLALYDIDLLPISPSNACKHPGSMDTILAAALNPGDLTVSLADASGWYNGAISTSRRFGWYGWINSKGYVYPDYSYTRNSSANYSSNSSLGTWLENGISGNVITLRVPWAGPALAAGTTVRNNSEAGGTYKYIAASNVIVPNIWTRYSGVIIPADGSALEVANQFRAGTAYVRLLFLVNYHGAADTNVRWSDLSFGEDLLAAAAGAGGSFTSANGKTITVVNGQITAIV